MIKKEMPLLHTNPKGGVGEEGKYQLSSSREIKYQT
jgi:hypothetical protein